MKSWLRLIQMILLSVLMFNISNAQDFEGEELEVYNTIVKLFDGMRASDSSMVRSVFSGECRMYSHGKNKEGILQTTKGDVDAFVAAIGKPKDQVWDERLWDTKIDIDLGIAQVWTEYGFFVGDKFSHCGVDAFQLIKIKEDWKIIQVVDTRKSEGCDPKK